MDKFDIHVYSIFFSLVKGSGAVNLTFFCHFSTTKICGHLHVHVLFYTFPTKKIFHFLLLINFCDFFVLSLSAVNLGTVATLGAHAMFAFLPNESFIALIAMILMGVAYSMLACALWPLVAFIVPEYQLGTAYGM